MDIFSLKLKIFTVISGYILHLRTIPIVFMKNILYHDTIEFCNMYKNNNHLSLHIRTIICLDKYNHIKYLNYIYLELLLINGYYIDAKLN